MATLRRDSPPTVTPCPYPVFSGLSEALAGIAALIPPPRHNLVRYHGVLAPNAKLRAQVVRHGRAEAKDAATAGKGGSRGQRERWALLMQRTFGLDVLACDRCGGRFELIATITDPRVARRILQHLKLPDWPPSQAPPRDPPPFWSSVA